MVKIEDEAMTFLAFNSIRPAKFLVVDTHELRKQLKDSEYLKAKNVFKITAR